jgi:hypothetical protein
MFQSKNTRWWGSEDNQTGGLSALKGGAMANSKKQNPTQWQWLYKL